MSEFTSVDELERFERRWKFVFTCFALILATALIDHMLRSPRGEEAEWLPRMANEVAQNERDAGTSFKIDD